MYYEKSNYTFIEVLSWSDYYPFGLTKDSRSNESSSYRFGFNGKEKDSWSADGNIYDYGFRILNTKYGRFMSIDPLTKSYPWNSTYAFAENRVIDGIDLDGLEYLKADEARIKVTKGKIKLNVENLTLFTRSSWYRANRDPNNWNINEIGLNTTLAYINYNDGSTTTASEVNLPYSSENGKSGRLSNKTSDPNYNPSNHKVVNPIAKSTGKNDRRYKNRTVSAGGTRMGASAAKGTLLLNAISFGLENGQWIAKEYDESLIDHQMKKVLPKAIKDVEDALNTPGMIPEQFRNNESISRIIDVVLQGGVDTGFDEVYDIGIRIVKEISSNYQGDGYTPDSDYTEVRDNTNIK